VIPVSFLPGITAGIKIFSPNNFCYKLYSLNNNN
jgi:hypothetical protein